MSVNPRDMSVQIEPSLDLTREGVAEFCTNCKRWAAKAYKIVGGGISLKISGDTINETRASIWWYGKKVVEIYQCYGRDSRLPPYDAWRDDIPGFKGTWVRVDEVNVWKELLGPLLLKLISEEKSRLDLIEKAVEAADWQETKLWWDI